MPLEEYNLLDADFAHCPGTHCEKANECLHYTAYKMLAKNTRDCYMITLEMAFLITFQAKTRRKQCF